MNFAPKLQENDTLWLRTVEAAIVFVRYLGYGRNKDLKFDYFLWLLGSKLLPYALEVFSARIHAFESRYATTELTSLTKVGLQCDVYYVNVDNLMSVTISNVESPNLVVKQKF